MQQGGGKGAMSFGRSRAKLLNEDQTKVHFADVAGCDEAKEEVSELVGSCATRPGSEAGRQDPARRADGRPPGTGKTLLAKAIAGEAKVPFFSISGWTSSRCFVGVGASRVRDMFEQAKKHAPCIIYHRRDRRGRRHRGAGPGRRPRRARADLNQLLVEMDVSKAAKA